MKIILSNEIVDYPDYLTDESRLAVEPGKINCIAFPENETDVVAALEKARENNWPVTVSAARTGIVGGAAPLCGGMVISMEKMSKIGEPEKNEQNGEWALSVEPGALLCDISKKLSETRNPKLFYPPDPTEMSAAIGGTVATNASGARTFKYGATRDYVLSLRIVLADGNILTIKRGEIFSDDSGTITFSVNEKEYKIPVPTYSMPKTKNCAGYFAKPKMDLIDLFIGSEGTLGIITEIEIKVLEQKKGRLSLLSFFNTEQNALDFVKTIRKQNGKNNFDIEAIEFFDKNALKLLNERREAGDTAIHEFPESEAAIYYEFALDDEFLEDIYEKLEEILQTVNCSTDTSWAGMDEDETKILKEFRHAVPETINQIIGERKRKIPTLHKIGTDLAVPNENFEIIFKFYQETLDTAGLQYAIFGHIGDNHLHVNMMPRNEEELIEAKKYYKIFAEKAIELGGTVSAEHGIGKLKKEFLKILYGEKGIEEMKNVKKVLDSNCILGKGNLI